MRELTSFLMALSVALASGPAFGHVVESHRQDAIWSFDPWIAALLTAGAFLYAGGVLRASKRAGPGRVFGGLEISAAAAAMVALAAALLSPVDTVGAQLFSVHMIQHLILMLVAAPLLVLSRPGLAMLWLLPRRARRSWGRTVFGVGRAGRWLRQISHPMAAWILYCAIFLFWHVPAPYRWAVESEAVHALEHATILLGGLMFWSVVIEPTGRARLDHGGRLLFVATAAALGGLPGALMILSPRPLYAVHADSVSRWGLTLLEDQQLAGLIMWIPSGFIYLCTAAILFLLWLRSAERRADRDQSLLHLTGRSTAVLLATLLVVGCEEQDARVSQFGGDATRGAKHIARMGCGGCHIVPGINGARGLVGPPLNHMARRIYIAGLLRNTPENMIYWLRNPQRVVPGNAMPDMGIGRQEARDIAAYLYTLE